jgi:hypothetical protein
MKTVAQVCASLKAHDVYPRTASSNSCSEQHSADVFLNADLSVRKYPKVRAASDNDDAVISALHLDRDAFELGWQKHREHGIDRRLIAELVAKLVSTLDADVVLVGQQRIDLD